MFDCHIHLDQYSDKDIALIMTQLDGAVVVSTDLKSAEKLHALKTDYPNIYIAAGFHPEQALPDAAEIDALENWIRTHAASIVAIGEVGLPQYLNREGKVKDMAAYVQLLERLIALAAELHLPVALHAVYDDALIALDLLEKYDIRGHFHWFKASDDVILKVLAAGHMVSVTPDVTWNHKTRRVIELAPIEQLMIETDGPWPHEGFSKTDVKAGLSAIIEMIGSIKNIDKNRIKHQLDWNARSFYLGGVKG